VFAENIPQIAQEKPPGKHLKLQIPESSLTAPPAAWNNLCPLYEASLNNQTHPKPPCKDKNHY
jgi:hypothetical protein